MYTSDIAQDLQASSAGRVGVYFYIPNMSQRCGRRARMFEDARGHSRTVLIRHIVLVATYPSHLLFFPGPGARA